MADGERRRHARRRHARRHHARRHHARRRHARRRHARRRHARRRHYAVVMHTPVITQASYTQSSLRRRQHPARPCYVHMQELNNLYLNIKTSNKVARNNVFKGTASFEPLVTVSCPYEFRCTILKAKTGELAVVLN
ncbi:hypothetical protein TNCV_290411 [Trichonephila clavipes]|nr:hypothetical protein TNCV_290411 [Trichonephila clavipes]